VSRSWVSARTTSTETHRSPPDYKPIVNNETRRTQITFISPTKSTRLETDSLKPGSSVTAG
jgi:hypothetical protein